MRALRLWIENHVWLVGTFGVAAIVFGVTFIAVSSATGDGPEIPERVVSSALPTSTEETEAQAQAQAEPEAEAEEPEPAAQSEAELDDPIEAQAAAEEQTEAEEQAQAQASVPESEEDEEEAVPAEEAEPAAALPEFDEESLVYGGTGADGAVLGGPGIVPSSGASAQTQWEFLLPSAQIRAAVVRVGLTYTNALGAPDNPEVIGWWDTGPEPGEAGNVLLDGHRDFTDTDGNIGTGVCWLLPNTQVGDFVILRANEDRLSYVYTVIETRSVVWNDPSGVEYLQPTSEPILTLVTCEGSFDEDAHNYSNRRIVVAELTDTIPFAED